MAILMEKTADSFGPQLPFVEINISNVLQVTAILFCLIFPDSTSVDPVTIGKDDPLWFPLRAKDEFKVSNFQLLKQITYQFICSSKKHKSVGAFIFIKRLFSRKTILFRF